METIPLKTEDNQNNQIQEMILSSTEGIQSQSRVQEFDGQDPSICRICHEECPYVIFCQCRGSLMMHDECLRESLEKGPKGFDYWSECEICKTLFEIEPCQKVQFSLQKGISNKLEECLFPKTIQDAKPIFVLYLLIVIPLIFYILTGWEIFINAIQIMILIMVIFIFWLFELGQGANIVCRKKTNFLRVLPIQKRISPRIRDRNIRDTQQGRQFTDSSQRQINT